MEKLLKLQQIMEKISNKEKNEIVPKEEKISDELASKEKNKNPQKQRIKDLVYKLIDQEISIDDFIDSL